MAAGFYFGISRTAPMPASITTTIIGTTTIATEVADTNAERSLGLSGRPSLAEGSGLLFVFDVPGTWGFWMKDMQFSIDILFIENGTVVTLYEHVSPQTYRQDPPLVFKPKVPATYVLEVPAGFAAGRGITEGARVEFK